MNEISRHQTSFVLSYWLGQNYCILKNCESQFRLLIGDRGSIYSNSSMLTYYLSLLHIPKAIKYSWTNGWGIFLWGGIAGWIQVSFGELEGGLWSIKSLDGGLGINKLSLFARLQSGCGHLLGRRPCHGGRLDMVFHIWGSFTCSARFPHRAGLWKHIPKSSGSSFKFTSFSVGDGSRVGFGVMLGVVIPPWVGNCQRWGTSQVRECSVVACLIGGYRFTQDLGFRRIPQDRKLRSWKSSLACYMGLVFPLPTGGVRINWYGKVVGMAFFSKIILPCATKKNYLGFPLERWLEGCGSVKTVFLHMGRCKGSI